MLEMNSPVLWLVMLAMVEGAVIVLQQFLHNRQTTMLMRSFLDKQGIPLHIMDGDPAPAPVVPSQPVARKRISIPIPGSPSALNWRKPQ